MRSWIPFAGGTHVPMDCLLNPVSREQRSKCSTTLTTLELSVARAIQTGKSNKAIAYILNVTKSTVKVHVKHIMTKRNAKNRTNDLRSKSDAQQTFPLDTRAQFSLY